MVETEKGACKWFLVSNGLINKLVYSGAKEFQVGVVLVTGVVLATFHLVNFPKSCFLRRYIDNMVFTYYKKKKKKFIGIVTKRCWWAYHVFSIISIISFSIPMNSRLFNYFIFIMINVEQLLNYVYTRIAT